MLVLGCNDVDVDVWCFRYVWQHLEVGYVQGMCDLVAPLLVILDDGMCFASFVLLFAELPVVPSVQSSPF